MSEEIKRDGAYWAEEYKKWKKSGQEQGAYCESIGLSFSKFQSGLKKASLGGYLPRRKKRSAEGRKEVRSGFKRVQIDSAQGTQAPYCEIWFGGQPGIRIETEESLSLIKALKGLL